MMDFFASRAETVTILKSQYENLLRVARQYENLRESLLRGGVSQDDIDVLVQDAVAPVPEDENPIRKSYHRTHQPQSGVSPSPSKPHPRPSSTSSFRPTQNPERHALSKNDPHHSGESIEEEDDDEQELDELDDQNLPPDKPKDKATPTPSKPDDDRGPRTIEIRNLPNYCTYLDVTKSIRGGALVQVFMLFRERAARVTFVDAAAAREFLARGEQIGIHIKNKKVDLSWSDREFRLRPYIKQSIAENGASRNLTIRNAKANITPALIREHLEHINDLVIIHIKTEPLSRSIYISTNSVHNAMFARSCMRSRAVYRGMKIGFGVDECAAPWSSVSSSSAPFATSKLSATAPEYQASSSTLPKLCTKRREVIQHSQGQRRSSSGRSVWNRFDLLTLDSGDSGLDDEEQSDDPAS